MGGGGMAVPLFKLGAWRGCVASATPPPLYPGERDSLPIVRRLSGFWDRAGRVRKISPALGFESRTVQPLARRYTDWAIPLVPVRVNILLTYPLLNWDLPSCLLLNIFFHLSSPVFMLHDSPMSLLIRSLQQYFVKVFILSGTFNVCCYLRPTT